MHADSIGLGENLARVWPDELEQAPPFSDLFPVAPSILKSIAESIDKEGYDDSKPIVVWRQRNVIVDGYTRWKAAIEAKQEVVVYHRDFADEQAALEYAIASQKNRRNLTDADIYHCVEVLHKARQKGGDRKSEEAKSIATSVAIDRSSQETADLVGTNRGKVEKAQAIKTNGTPEVKAAVANGTMSINKGYRMTREERDEIAEQILADLRSDHLQTNVDVADRHGVGTQVVKRLRKKHEIPGSGSKGGGKYHKAASVSLDVIEPEPHLDPVEVEPEATDEPDFEALLESQKRAIIRLFETHTEETQGLFVMMLRSLTNALAYRCPRLIDLNHEPLT